LLKQSEGADDGESEYIDEGMSVQEDELVSDDEQEVRFTNMILFSHSV